MTLRHPPASPPLPDGGLSASYDYDLPPDRIAQEPAPERDGARLLVLRRGGGDPEHRRITDLPDLLRPGDLLVVNDTRVRPARLFGRRESGGRVEVLLLARRSRAAGEEIWTALARASRPLRAGTRLRLEEEVPARVEEVPGAGDEGGLTLRLRVPGGEDVEAWLDRRGTLPLPPYIRREPGDGRAAADRERYQTVYARETGSAAAPTAGLHLSRALLRRLTAIGVRTAAVTLHVGPGTFRPIRSAQLSAHRMHSEWCRLSPQTAEALRRTRSQGGRIVAVGTTVVRTLEARWGPEGPRPGEGTVDLFLRPGWRFRAVDALLTNFHLPRSSLLVLVSAFAGRERVLDAYRQAVDAGYRFYSYGDAMWIE